MPKWLRENGEKLAEKLKIARRRAKRSHKKFLKKNRKAQHAHEVGEEAEKRAKELKREKPGNWRGKVSYQEAKATRAHRRAAKFSDQAQFHRKRRGIRNRRQEELELKWNKYIRDKRKWQKDHPPPSTDGKMDKWGDRDVADGFFQILTLAVQKGWDGYVTSGYRSPAYSQQLCYGMCGAPSCPGRCAGTSSNHVGASVAAGGAVDVTDYYEFGDIMDEINVPIRVFNGLGYRDPVHFSRSGN